MIDTEMGRGVTVMVAVARLVVSTVERAVIVLLPSDTAVTTPVAFTVAVAGLLERHVTVVARLPSAVTVAVNGCVLPMKIDAVVGAALTARMTGTTLIVAVARKVVSATEIAVIVVVPNATPVTRPAWVTVATLAALLRQLTLALSPFSMATVATSD